MSIDSNEKRIFATTKIRVHPQYLNTDILKHLDEKLKQKLEHKWTEKFGYIEFVDMLRSDTGKIDSKSGFTEFNVDYSGIANKPFVGQILLATVTNVTKLGIHFEHGPLQFFMHEKMIPSSYIFANSYYKCQRTGFTIRRGAQMRIKIVGTSWSDNKYVSFFSKVFFANCFIF